MNKITSTEELLSGKHKSVWIVPWKKNTPVAFIQNWQLRMVHNMIRAGHIETSRLKPKPERKPYTPKKVTCKKKQQ